jgi:Universal stress protein family.
MYSRMLIPLDGSKLAEQVLPYARYLANALTLPVELFQAVDAAALEALANPAQSRYIDTLLNEKRTSSAQYLETVGKSFQQGRIASAVAATRLSKHRVIACASTIDALGSFIDRSHGTH